MEPYPTTMGHEAMGVVVEIGPRSEAAERSPRALHVGDRVAIGGCESAFAQYVLAPAFACMRIPESMSDDEASLFEPWTILWGACKATVQYDETVLILGQGALGLFATQWARIFGARTVITSDPIPMKRDLSGRFGADHVIDPTAQNVTEEVDRLTGGRGCRLVFECAGEPDTIANLPYVTGLDGTIVQIGACCVPVTVDWSYIHFKGLHVHSATSAARLLTYGRSENAFMCSMAAALKEKERGRLHLAEMITHHPRFSVEGVTELFREIEEQATVVKAAFHPWED